MGHPNQSETAVMNRLKLTSAFAAALLISGCATNPETGNFEITRTGVGLAVGTVGGALLGSAVGGSSAVIKGAMIGAAAGGGAGYLWDKREKAMRAELAATELKVEQAKSADGSRVLLLSAQTDVFFKVGSSDIAPEAYPALTQLADALKLQNYKIGITGHTDISGTPERNNRLSYDRARAVAAYLTSAGVRPQTMFVRGAGSKEPKTSNATPEGRSENRRVEIELSDSVPRAKA